MRTNTVWDVVLAVAVSLIFGYTLGGLVYQHDQTDILSNPAKILYDYQGLVGGLFTLLAAGTAWSAVQAQLDAAERHRAEDRRRSQNATANSVLAALLETARWMHNIGEELSLADPHIGEFVRDARRDVIAIHALLGITINDFYREYIFWRQMHARFKELNDRDLLSNPSIVERYRREILSVEKLRTEAQKFEFRTIVYSEIFAHVANALNRGEALPNPLLSKTIWQGFGEQYGADERDLGWLSMLTRIR